MINSAPLLSFGLRFFLIFAVFVILIFITSQATFAQKISSQYLRMKQNSRLLFDKWAIKQNEIVGEEISAPERFNLLHISRRSTFAAISNALLYTKLTDQSGRSLGFAVDLIDEIEDIAGQQDGKGGDEQFRLYVKLKPDAVEKLDLSKEFIRDKDNSVFHKGFPLNYRQSGLAPSLQYSITKELKKRKRLDQAIRPIAPIAPFIKAVEHSQKDFFTLAAITDGDYEHFVCISKNSELTSDDDDSQAQTYGNFYVVKFQFLLENGDGGILRLLWSKEGDKWKIESFDAVTA